MKDLNRYLNESIFDVDTNVDGVKSDIERIVSCVLDGLKQKSFDKAAKELNHHKDRLFCMKSDTNMKQFEWEALDHESLCFWFPGTEPMVHFSLSRKKGHIRIEFMDDRIIVGDSPYPMSAFYKLYKTDKTSWETFKNMLIKELGAKRQMDNGFVFYEI